MWCHDFADVFHRPRSFICSAIIPKNMLISFQSFSLPHWADFFSRRRIYDRSILSACFTYRTILDVILCVVGLVVSLSRATASHKLLHIHFDFWRIMLLIHHTNVVCLQKIGGRVEKEMVLDVDCNKCEKWVLVTFPSQLWVMLCWRTNDAFQRKKRERNARGVQSKEKTYYIKEEGSQDKREKSNTR